MRIKHSGTSVLVLLASFSFAAAVGRPQTLLVIEPSKEQPRNSEGDMIELKDGRLCLIYTRFSGGGSDHAAADLAMRTSRDGGKTWSDDRIVVRREGGQNVMSVSLLRLADGRIALFYLRKMSLEDCRPIMRVSDDEARTWSGPTVCITDQVGYYVLNNDRAVQLAGGRIVLPVALHNRPGQKRPDWAGRLMCYLSDDVGKTWRRGKSTLLGKSPAGKRITVQEPGVVALADGRLMMFSRTSAGSQYICYSKDEGETWTPLEPSKLASPVSPATIERIPWSGDLLCVWNDHSGVHPFPTGRRTPLCVAVSRDEGHTWSQSHVIEPDPDGWYCYTSVMFQQDRVLLSYCAGDRKVGGLNRLKVAALSKEQLQQVALKTRKRQAPAALLEPCLDYGRSFINTKATWNSPRFWVESRCQISDAATGKTVVYYQCGSCKSERTFAKTDLFQQDNYDFLPIFSKQQTVVFRRYSRLTERYRQVKPDDQWWGGTVPVLRTFKGRVLATPRDIFLAMDAGKPLIGQTELRDEKTGRTAVLEYPIKTINWHREKKIWQVDTGPVVLPDLTAPPKRWPHTIQLAYIAFSGPDWADFVVEQPTPIKQDGKEVARVYHYSGIVHKTARNVILALEED